VVNECFVLSATDLAAMFAQDWPADFQRLKAELPAWTLFYTVAGYDYYPEERVAVKIKDIAGLTGQRGLESAKDVPGLAADDILKAIQTTSAEPYWKLRSKGGCEDIFFLTTVDRIDSLVALMAGLAEKAGYPAADCGVYIQPAVQGTSWHCEFSLFYDPSDAVEAQKVKELSASATKALMESGAFFSRPYGDSAGVVMNRDAASVEALKKLKKIFDPNEVMNPGKLCF
jgi:FAD/FMN-containing dehydrogenase